MELLFSLFIIAGVLLIIFTAIESDSWGPAIVCTISTLLIVIGFVFYLSMEPRITQHTLVTDRLEMPAGEGKESVIFPRPTHIKIVKSRIWGSLTTNTDYIVGGE